jgi:hypothetical protein
MIKTQRRTADQLFPLVFGGAVAIVLLLLYAITVFYIVFATVCDADQTCPNTHMVTDGTILVFTTVGGLVSALVISHLATARPGEIPISRFVPADATDRFKTTVSIISVLYIIVWMIAGLAALIVGVMLFPDRNKTLSDAATTWLGLAIAAGYSYFGIQPP